MVGRSSRPCALGLLMGALSACASVPPSHQPSPHAPPDRARAQQEQGLLPGALRYRPLAVSQPEQASRFLLRTDSGARLLSIVRPVQPGAVAHPRGIVVGHGNLPEAVEPWHRRPSFLVDFDRPEVDALARKLPLPPSLPALRETVAAYFTEVVHGQFLVASESVQRRRGDCSEQAVLAAALARAVGMPARLVVGYALLPEALPPVALGHVWTQVHDGERWQTVDASEVAHPDREYLIMGMLEDEGPDYRAELNQRVGPLRIDAVEAL